MAVERNIIRDAAERVFAELPTEGSLRAELSPPKPGADPKNACAINENRLGAADVAWLA
jgi:hypothetical protein